MRVGVAFEAERREHAFRDRALGNASAGDVDLEDGAGQKSRTGIPACPFSSSYAQWTGENAYPTF